MFHLDFPPYPTPTKTPASQNHHSDSGTAKIHLLGCEQGLVGHRERLSAARHGEAKLRTVEGVGATENLGRAVVTKPTVSNRDILSTEPRLGNAPLASGSLSWLTGSSLTWDCPLLA